MIPNQWYVVLESREVRKGQPVGVIRMGEKMVFWRRKDGKVVCMSDRCPHLGASLSGGKVADDHLACPFHAFEFDSTGACRYIPALGRNGVPPKAMRVKSYPTYEAHGFIWIYWGEPQGSLTPPKFFDIDETFSYAGYRQMWNVHYSRMVENQLDVMHLPHVHTDTIGRGKRVVVDGPLVKVEDGVLKVWVFNRKDDGNPPRRADDLVMPDRPPFLEFIFPNLWQNRISPDFRIVVAFVPVDEEHGMFYLRQYQRFVRVPVLREIVNWFGVLASHHIAEQDRRVVNTQLPKKSSLRGEDKPIQCDNAVLTYRRVREELIEKARNPENQA
ncbi:MULTISPECIES: aromatic ring-hydroxylating dioxygenase subunit alpha [Anaerolinea]|uniref:aromatic ring-hydroxylating oxygenase subunit alpha n=1 Tax=Anaerolinea TaxID=233189 RepID=UPI00262983F0|nr:aromatic ring-hydroxylating dioxygenase subunit alpha [Anaerolinea thermophila]